MGKHSDFINKPIETVLSEAINAISNLGNGIDIYPTVGYVLQAVFIQMTGFQEQKLKCIAWDMATDNFEFRRTFLKAYSSIGFSDLKSKQNLYKELVNIIGIKELDEKTRQQVINSSFETETTLVQNSNLLFGNERHYQFFLKEAKNILSYTKIARQNKLLVDNDSYKRLYNYRNRVAHNTVSYQHNLPRLQELETSTLEDRNYFFWFFILIVIDKIFIELYNKFQDDFYSIF
jgi:hypothetical protein